jgi:3-phenylpropionate/trans-cinnamate dioxygenase ferredoxin subunit
VTWYDATSSALPDGSVVGVRAGEELVVLARTGGAWLAVDAWCTHAECPLTDGWLEGAAIRCACHGALFDLATGEPVEGPAEEAVRTHRTRVVGDRVEVEVT